MEQREGYAPGWSDDVLSMMGWRKAGDRAAFVLPFLAHAARLVDVGCGPGSITAGLAQAAPTVSVLGVDREDSQVALAREGARAAGATNVEFEQGSAYDLPVADRNVDVVFAHAVFEHLADPVRALVEFGRVLRPGGVVAVSSSDWSHAQLDPFDEEVEQALEGHYLLRRRAGGDPFMGSVLAGLVADAGFVDVVAQRADRVDMAYDELARYVGARVHAALDDSAPDATPADLEQLQRAAQAAQRWASRRGRFTQCWVEVTARWPLRTGAPPSPAPTPPAPTRRR